MAKRYYITKPVVISALGNNADETLAALQKGERRFTRNSAGILVGRAQLAGDTPLHTFRAILDEAARQLQADAALVLSRCDTSRVGVVLGGCDYNSQAAAAEHKKHADSGNFRGYNVDSQNPYQPVERLRDALGLRGPSFAVATACASGLTAVIRGIDLLDAGEADAMLVGGVDFASDLIAAGFSSLSAVSDEPTNPFSANRKGITLGDGAGLFFLSKKPLSDFPVAITGWAESSDGYNMTSPEPEGKAVVAMLQHALQTAGLRPEEIGYVNLHGTGTEANDAMESKAVSAVFGTGAKVSSTKAMTGHTLGAAGAMGTAFCALTLAQDAPQILPPQLNDGADDPALPKLNFARPGERQEIRAAVCQAFAFGGANAALVLERLYTEKTT